MIKSIKPIIPMILLIIFGYCSKVDNQSKSTEKPFKPKFIIDLTIDNKSCSECHKESNDFYKQSAHFDKNISCDQCHIMKRHYMFTKPVSDITCGGCHSEHLSQVQNSKHFKKAFVVNLSPQDIQEQVNIRKQIRKNKYLHNLNKPENGVSKTFIKNRLCFMCHYNNHTFKLSSTKASPAVQDKGFCTICHIDRKNHKNFGSSNNNRCLSCHVKVGENSKGQKVNTHLFSLKK